MLSLWKEEIENWVCNLACIECSKGGCARAFPPKKKKKWKKNAFFLLCTFRKVIHDFCQMLFLGKKYRMYYEVTYYEKDTQLLHNTCHLPTTYVYSMYTTFPTEDNKAHSLFKLNIVTYNFISGE